MTESSWDVEAGRGQKTQDSEHRQTITKSFKQAKFRIRSQKRLQMLEKTFETELHSKTHLKLLRSRGEKFEMNQEITEQKCQTMMILMWCFYPNVCL